MPMVTLHKVGDGNVYHLHVLDQRTDPGYGGGLGGGVDPGYGRPEGGRPDQGLPGGGWGGRPDNTLPGQGGLHPGNRPPGSGGGIPDNSLPTAPPPNVAPGWLLVLARGQDGKWHYAAMAPGSAPPKPLPEPLPPDAGTKPIDPNAPEVAPLPAPPLAPA